MSETASDQHTSLVSLSAYVQAVHPGQLRDGHQQQQQAGTAVHGRADPSLLERGLKSSLSHSPDGLSSAVRREERRVNGILPTSHRFAHILSGFIVAFQFISVNVELEFCRAGCNECAAWL